VGALTIVQRPQLDVIDVTTAKRALRIDTAADDEKVQRIIGAATAIFDGNKGLLGRALMPQTWQLDIEDLPLYEISLPLPPLIQVTSVTYWDSTFTRQTLDPATYRIIPGGDEDVSTIRRVYNTTWPTVLTGEPDGVSVTFDCGYQDLQSPANNPVPGPIKEAILVIAQAMYDTPGDDFFLTDSLSPKFKAAFNLARPYMLKRLGYDDMKGVAYDAFADVA